LLRSVGLAVNLYDSVAEFIAAPHVEGPCCLVLDVRLPGQSGLDLQDALASADVAWPVVFISGVGDIPMTVRAMKAGAIEFLTKPFRDQDLLDAINLGLERHRESLIERAAQDKLRRAFEALTQREQRVMALVALGRLNKQIAGDLGISEVTVKAHRGQVMRKMGARSLADLVRMADRLGLTPPR
jgi:FixJ family two-component response regulator